MRGKVKLKMIDDYVALFRIIYYCQNCMQDISSPKLSQNLSEIANNAMELKDKFETAFKREKMCDASFLLLKSQLLRANKTGESPKHKVSADKLHEMENKLKLLECNHNANLLKLR